MHYYKAYNIPYITRGKGAKTVIGKILYLFKAVYILNKLSRKFEPELFLSFIHPTLLMLKDG